MLVKRADAAYRAARTAGNEGMRAAVESVAGLLRSQARAELADVLEEMVRTIVREEADSDGRVDAALLTDRVHAYSLSLKGRAGLDFNRLSPTRDKRF